MRRLVRAQRAVYEHNEDKLARAPGDCFDGHAFASEVSPLVEQGLL